MVKQREVLPDISQWQVESVRLTAFITPSVQFVQPKWWMELTGVEAEVRNILPGKGELTEQGPFELGVLTLKVTPFRIDWLYSPKVSTDVDDSVWATLGLFPDVGDKFLKL